MLSVMVRLLIVPKISYPLDTRNLETIRVAAIAPSLTDAVTQIRGFGLNPAERRDWGKGITHFPDEVFPVRADYWNLAAGLISKIS